MQIEWYVGPDRDKFDLDEAGRVRSTRITPFHGIVSQGLRQRLEDGQVPSGVWLRNAHRLFDETEPPDPELTLLRQHARAAVSLSFAESAAAVRSYLDDHREPKEDARRVAAWNIKEGHTSSVWRVALLNEHDDAAPAEFVLNVARDNVAGRDLKATSERMRELKSRHPGLNLAAVLDAATVTLARAEGPLEVVVTANEWVPDSLEVHPLRTSDQRPGEYVLVERFLTSPLDPAEIVSIRGRRCSPDERHRIDHGIERFRRAALTVPDPPDIDLGHGDVVWNGREAVVVAIS